MDSVYNQRTSQIPTPAPTSTMALKRRSDEDVLTAHPLCLS